jgi:hypothetical protein
MKLIERNNMSKIKTKLLPCPFCRSEAESLVKSHRLNTIRCTNGDCPGSQSGFHEKSEDAAIAAWNRRPDNDLVDALETIACGLSCSEVFGGCNDRYCNCDSKIAKEALVKYKDKT